jgi:hypothetical protein
MGETSSKQRQDDGRVFVSSHTYRKKSQTFSISVVGSAANGKSFTSGFVTEADWKIKAAIAPIMKKLATKRTPSRVHARGCSQVTTSTLGF